MTDNQLRLSPNSIAVRSISIDVRKGGGVYDLDNNLLVKREDIFVGRYIAVPTLWGYRRAVVEAGTNDSFWADTDNSAFNLEFDDNFGWSSSFGFNKNLNLACFQK